MTTSNSLTSFTTVAQATMTSLELVEYINIGRKEKAESAGRPFPSKGHAAIKHNDLLKKIEAHPGIHSGKFFAEYTDSTGRTLKCYNLPEREARLMVMAESLEVQTKVLDKLIELEKTVATAQLTANEVKRIELDYAENLKHSLEYEVGARMMAAVRCADEDNETILNEALEGIDFDGAARVQGLGRTGQQVRAQTLDHIKASRFVGQIRRGEHQHPDRVLDAISFVRLAVEKKRASERFEAYRLEINKAPLTLAQIDANDRAHKHDIPQPKPVPVKRVARKR